MADGKSKVAAIKICQTSTGDSYRTGKKSKNENIMSNIYERTYDLVEKEVRTSILEKDIRTFSKVLGKIATGTARMGAEAGRPNFMGPGTGRKRSSEPTIGNKDLSQDDRDRMKASRDQEISQFNAKSSGLPDDAGKAKADYEKTISDPDVGQAVAAKYQSQHMDMKQKPKVTSVADEPQKKKGGSFWDRTKTAARIVGLTPGPIGFGADAAAAGITGIQRIFAKTPERKSQLNWELAGDAAAMVPIAGQGARLAGTAAKKAATTTVKKAGEVVAPKTSAKVADILARKKATKAAAEETAKKAAADKAAKEAAEKAAKHAARPKVIRKTIDAVKGAKRKIGQASKFGRKVAGKGMRRLTLGASMLGDRGDSNQDDNKRGTSKQSYSGGADSRKKKRSSGMEDPKKLSRIKRGTR